MWPRRVVVLAPPLDQYPRLQQLLEDLAIEQFVPQLAVETLGVPVLPRRARLDKERLHAERSEPVSHRGCGEFWTVVAADVARYTTRRHAPRETHEYVVALERPRDIDRQSLTRVLIDDHQHPYGTTVRRPRLNEAVRPDVIAVPWTEPHAAYVVEPQTVTLRLLSRHLQALLPPAPLGTLVVHLPPFTPQVRRDPRCPVPSVDRRQFDDPRRPAAASAGRSLSSVLSASSLVGLEPAVLLPPAVVRLLRHPEQLAHRRDGRALAELDLRLAELVDDRISRMALPGNVRSS